MGKISLDLTGNPVDAAKQLLPVPPDGGYGWVIVIGAFCSNLIVDGICNCFTEFKPSYAKEFKGSDSLTALIGSLLIGVYLLVGPFVGVMCNRLGARKTVIIGSIVSGCAFVLSTFSPSLSIFIVIYGVLGGIGFGMIYLPAIVTVGQYFESKRAVATGLAVAGSGVGTMVMPFVARFAIQNFAWKGADWVLAGLILLCSLFGLLYKGLTAPVLIGASGVVERKTTKDKVVPKETLEEPDAKREVTDRIQRALSHQSEQDDESVFADSWAKSSSTGPRNGNDMPMSRIRNELSQCDDADLSFAKSWANRQKGGDTERRPSGALSQCDEDEEMTFAQSWAKAIAARKVRPLSRLRNEVSQCEDGEHGFAKSWAGQKARRTSQLRQRKLTLTGVTEELTQPKGDIAKSLRELRINLTGHEAEEIAKPLNRQDVLYMGSVTRLSQYKKEGGGLSYRASITTIPRKVLEEEPLTEEEKGKSKWIDTLGEIIDFDLLREPIMLLFCLTSLLGSLGYFTPFFFLKDLAISKGVPEKDTIYFVPVIGVTNTIGRIISGWLADRQFVSPLSMMSFALITCGLLCLGAPFCATYTALLIYGALFGFIISAYVCLTSIVLVSLLGIERLTSSFGLLAMFRGVASLLGTPFAGLAYDLTKSYDVCFYVGGAVMLLAGLVSCLIPIVQHCRKSRGEQNEENITE